MLINQVISWQDRTFRVISLLMGKAALFPFDSTTPRPVICEEQELDQKLDSGEIKLIADAYANNQYNDLDEKGDTKSVTKAQKNYELIKPVVEDPDCIFNQPYRLKRIREITNDDPSLKKQIARLLPKFWIGGQTLKALLPQYRDTRGKHRITANKVGRKGRADIPGLVVNEKIIALFDQIIKQHILKPEGLSVRGAYIHVLNEFGKKPAYYTTTPNATPSFAQFKYYYYRNYNAKDRSVKKHADRVYQRDIRPLTGTIYDIASGPGALYEVDATLADLYVVDQEGNCLGRPTLYSVVDVYSGMIAAIDVSLDSAQYSSVSRVLYSAFCNKSQLCQKYQVNCTDSEWPVQGLPAKICADNAELLGDKIEHFCRKYGTAIVNTASYRADMKGTVERSLGMLQDFIKEYVKAHPDKVTLKKAGARDLRYKTVLTLEDCHAILLEAAIAVNHRPRELTPDYYPPQKEPSSFELWHYGRAKGRSMLRNVTDFKLLKLALQNKYEVSLSRDGAMAKGLNITYYCSRLNELGYLERGRSARKNSGNMRLVISPSDVSKAYLFPDIINDGGVYYECELAVKSRFLRGKTITEAKEIIAAKKKSYAKAEAGYQQVMAKAHENIKKRTDEAQRRQDANPPITRQNIKNSSQNRKRARIEQERAYETEPVLNDKPKTSLYHESSKTVRSKNSDYPDSFDDIPD